jgi:hypothetical protein
MGRAQAALEFLMTYGWAILVVLAAIGALAYFGVFNSGKLVPDKCTIGPGMDIKDCKASTTGFTMSLYNGLGADLTNVQMIITFAGGSDVVCDISGVPTETYTVQYGALADSASNLSTICPLGTRDTPPGTPTNGMRMDADLAVVYQKSGTQLNHTIAGKIQRRVEQ